MVSGLAERLGIPTPPATATLFTGVGDDGCADSDGDADAVALAALTTAPAPDFTVESGRRVSPEVGGIETETVNHDARLGLTSSAGSMVPEKLGTVAVSTRSPNEDEGG